MGGGVAQHLQQVVEAGLLGPGMTLERALRGSQAFLSVLSEFMESGQVVDLGSGWGLPGLVVAEGWAGRGEVLFTERSARKAAYLRTAISVLGLSHCRVFEGSVEDPPDDLRVRFDALTAWRFASLKRTCAVAEMLLRDGGYAVISVTEGTVAGFQSGDLHEPRMGRLVFVGSRRFRELVLGVFRKSGSQ
jgi:16S rRNA G527 N7-methylase RsmG